MIIKHEKKSFAVKYPSVNAFKSFTNTLPVSVTIEDAVACRRYSGVSISGVIVKESPEWLKKRLKSIGVRPINNLVTIHFS